MPRDRSFEKISVLVVDHDQHMRKIVRSLLSGFGIHRIYEAADGAQGLELLAQNRPDVVLTEWDLPMLDGAEMVRLIRRPDSPFATVGIILMTARPERRLVQMAMRLGINEILVKPFSAKGLLDRLTLVVHHPRPFVQNAGYFGPAPRAPRGLEYAGQRI